MTRANARELAVHLIYGREFTGEEPEQVVSARLEREYYAKLSQENEVYAERPSRAQLAYIDGVVSGVANRIDELNETIQQFSIGWDVSRISRLARAIMQLAIFFSHPCVLRYRSMFSLLAGEYPFLQASLAISMTTVSQGLPSANANAL